MFYYHRDPFFSFIESRCTRSRAIPLPLLRAINLLEFRYIARSRRKPFFFLADRSSFSISHPRPSDFFRFFFPSSFLLYLFLFFSFLFLEIGRGGFAFTTVDRVGSRSPEYAMRFIRNVAYKTQRTVYDW